MERACQAALGSVAQCAEVEEGPERGGEGAGEGGGGRRGPGGGRGRGGAGAGRGWRGRRAPGRRGGQAGGGWCQPGTRGRPGSPRRRRRRRRGGREEEKASSQSEELAKLLSPDERRGSPGAFVRGTGRLEGTEVSTKESSLSPPPSPPPPRSDSPPPPSRGSCLRTRTSAAWSSSPCSGLALCLGGSLVGRCTMCLSP